MTQSFIGIENEDGSVEFIYCRDTNSDILFERYTTSDDIRNLISHGDMSKLGSFIHPSEVGKTTHSFDTPESDVCIFYHRDAGDDLQITYKNSLDELKTFGNFDGFLYIYSVRENEWKSYPKLKEEKWVTLGVG
jgi:hypothetical protein